MKNKKISIFLNILIFLFTVTAAILMFAGIKFTRKMDIPLECSGFEFLKFFTVQSNIFAGIMALFFVIYNILNKEISQRMYILKYMSTCAVFLTLFVVFVYLGWIVPNGLLSLLTNANLFFHLIIPLLSVITFIFFERENNLNFNHVKYGAFPATIYGVGYILNAVIHLKNGTIPIRYDFYGFLQYGFIKSLIAVCLVYLSSYLISFLLWKFNNNKK